MSSSNCCFLTCIQISQETGQMVWYSHLFWIFHSLLWSTVKGFGIVNKAETDVLLVFNISQNTALTYSFSYLEPVCHSMSSSNCCFLTCIQVSQGGGQVVWYSHLFQKFPQFLVIHTVKGFGIVNKAEIDVFLELSCFFDDPADVGNLISDSSAFSKSSLNIWKFTVHILLEPGLENFEHYFTLEKPICRSRSNS